MTTACIYTARLDEFKIPATPLLWGDRLERVLEMQASIGRNGLQKPLIVQRCGSKLIVVDGKYRLLALRRLQFQGRLPQPDGRIPYILHSSQQDRAREQVPSEKTAETLTDAAYFQIVEALLDKGLSISEAAARLSMPKDYIRTLLSVRCLSPHLRRAFLSGDVSLPQAKAFAAMPNPQAQDALWRLLGPFAEAPDIIEAIERGDTVLGYDDNIIILPSRAGTNSAPDLRPHAA